ncbi:MAG: UDP-N-acetylmuramate--alanine ligase [Limisphaerales bacterium]|jgi:UDP-N-acetylmuramate--alanine ligase
MINLKGISTVYFIGVGGIGMSALARYFIGQGKVVSGYDKNQSTLTDQLQREGIKIHFEPQPAQISSNIDLVVYTPAIPSDFSELQAVKKINLPLYKRAEILGLISNDYFTVAIAGSHGKTTVSSMIAHILESSGRGCTAFLGGITLNYQSNFIGSSNDVIVIEADEFDRSFLYLNPNIAVVTAVDTDHLDVYGDRSAIEEAFANFIGKIRDGGKLIARWGLDVHEYYTGRSVSYSLDENTADFHLGSLDAQPSGSYFTTNKTSRKYHLAWPGIHNVENALAAIAVADQLEIPEQDVAAALNSFKGIARRYQVIIESPDCTYIDDYAHHPEEINALLRSIRKLYWDKKITAVFQPHLYSRTRDFADDFVEALAEADRVVLLEIYPARELPIEGISSQMLADKMTRMAPEIPVLVVSKEDLPAYIKGINPQVLLTMGAGDIDRMVAPLKQILSNP